MIARSSGFGPDRQDFANLAVRQAIAVMQSDHAAFGFSQARHALVQGAQLLIVSGLAIGRVVDGLGWLNLDSRLGL